MPRYQLTPQVEDVIAGFVSKGVYGQVAAEAAGIPGRVFDQWMRRGARRGTREEYRHFYKRISKARAAARLRLEMKVHDTDAQFWLRYGPGREFPGSPGWSAPVKAAAPAAAAVADGPEWNALWSTVLQTLTPYPEARQALVLALRRRGEPQASKDPQPGEPPPCESAPPLPDAKA
jgi:hypothetical protein